jgi:hypothetical protein
VNLGQCVQTVIPTWGTGDQTTVELTVSAATAYGDAAEGVGYAFKPPTPAQAPSPQPNPGPAAAPVTGTWSFAGGTPGQDVNFKVHMNDPGVTAIHISFHEATPIQSFTAPSGWTCQTVTSSHPDDQLTCTHPTGEPAGTDVTGSVHLASAGSNGMPVSLSINKGDGSTYQTSMTQM